MSKETFCELLPPGIGNVNNLLKIPNKREILPQSSNYRKESSPIVKEGKFSKETRKKLTDGGYFICEVGNHSIEQLLGDYESIKIGLHSDITISKSQDEYKKDNKFSRNIFGLNKRADFLTHIPIKSEVSFNPRNFFNRDNNMFLRLSPILEERREAVIIFDNEVRKIIASERDKLKNMNIEKVNVIFGEAVEYVDAIKQFTSTGGFIRAKKKNDLGEFFTTASFSGIEKYNSADAYVDIYACNQGKLKLEIGVHCRCHPHGYVCPLVVPK